METGIIQRIRNNTSSEFRDERLWRYILKVDGNASHAVRQQVGLLSLSICNNVQCY